MAYKNKELINPLTGQDILFLQTAKDTNGEYLEMETTYHSNSTEPPLHYHPSQSEDFNVLSGELTVKINGEKRILKQGDTLHINPNESHAMWNTSGNKAVVHWKVQPAMNTENLFETINGLIKDGKTNSKGMPGILQLSLTVSKFSPVFRLAKPSYIIQKILFSIIKPFALLFGYRPVYKKYFD
ncbi:MAG: cupin domain-containing protein [Bacteroidota bacterium]